MTQQNIESILREERRFEPSEEFVAGARLKKTELDALHVKAQQDYEGFWADLAREQITWHKDFSVVLDSSNAPNFRWFTDGELNVSYNCIDRNLKVRGNKAAIIFEGEQGDTRSLTYSELHAEICRFANALKEQGVAKGDRIVIYMPMIPETVI